MRELPPGEPPSHRRAQTLGAEHPAFIAHSHSLYPAFVLEVPNGRVVTSGGIVVTSTGEALTETAWDPEQLERMLTGRRLRTARRHHGPLASIVSQWHENYFHWVLDVLPRYAQLERAGFGGLPLLVPDRLGRIRADSLALLGVDRAQLVAFRHENVAADLVVWPSPAGHTGNPLPWACEWLRGRVVREPTQRRRRLYVSRRSARSRRVVDESRLLETLEPLGFEIVFPERLTFAEQVATFAAADAVVAPHGAGLTNLVFSAGAVVIELFEPSYVNPCYYELSQSCGHSYWYVLGERRADGNIAVDASLIAATVRTALHERQHA